MKTILLIFILFVSLKAYTVNCKFSVTASSFYSYSQIGNLQGVYEAYPEGGYIIPSLNVVDNGFLYWDNNSPICGGNTIINTLHDSYCSDTGGCSHEPSEGVSSNALIKYIDGNWTNIVILVEGYPCLDYPLTTFSVGLYKEITHDSMGMFAFAVDRIFRSTESFVSSSLAAEQRAICEEAETPDPSSGANYTAQLNTLIDNTSKNKSQNERSKTLSDKLSSFIDNLNPSDGIDTDLTGFESTFEGKLGDAYSQYEDVFGFSSYGTAPAVISFELFDNTYEVFNIEVIDPYIDNIRLMFLVFAYLWGFIIVIKTI